MLWLLTIIISLVVNQEIVHGKPGYGGTNQEWDYVEVRPGVHMFWWLYYVNPPIKYSSYNIHSKPLIIWLQGGPGYGSSGLGNFMEFGPLDMQGKRRDTTWVDDYNVLLIDAPVGAGFSYADSDDLYATTDDMIVTDILTVIEHFMVAFPAFQDVPTYIVGQSYGGKLAVRVAWSLYGNKKGTSVNLKGIGLISPAISILDSVVDWPNFAYYMGLVDSAGRSEMAKDTDEAVELGKQNRSAEAKALGDAALIKLWGYASALDFNNVGQLTKKDQEFNQDITDLQTFMNSQVKGVLELTHDFGEQSEKAYNAIEPEMFTSSVHIVESILRQTSLKIALVGGVWDFMVGITGAAKWVDKMFENDPGWKNVPRNPLFVNDFIEGYQKQHGKFSFYTVLRSGHRVPADNGAAVKEILRQLTGS